MSPSFPLSMHLWRVISQPPPPPIVFPGSTNVGSVLTPSRSDIVLYLVFISFYVLRGAQFKTVQYPSASIPVFRIIDKLLDSSFARPNPLREILSLVVVSFPKNSLQFPVPGVFNLGNTKCFATYYGINHMIL